MQKRLYTLGYEGLTIERFLDKLVATRVKTVIDVRANPLSRKKGFSKRSLALALEHAGLAYVHMPAMGCPKNVRDRYRVDSDWTTYTRGFLKHLGKQSGAVEELVAIAQRSPACLICFEADFNRCHRLFVARAVAEAAPLCVTHLTAQTAIADAAVLPAA
jgi:uncharacterized protein (DUF488 family)